MTPEDAFKIYLNVLSVLAIIIVPISFYCVIRAWGFVRKYRGYVLPVVLAAVGTIAFPIALYIGVLAWLRLRGEIQPLPWTPAVSALVFLILDFIPIIVTGYLIWLDSRSGDRRSPPSE